MHVQVSAMEENLLGYALWCYEPDHSAKWGDGWNLEDLSIWSPELHCTPGDPYSGGRALHAVARPGATRVAGVPHTSRFHMQSGRYGLGFTTTAGDGMSAAGGAGGETHIFVPMLHYPHGFDVFVSEGEVREAEALTRHRCRQLVFRHSPECTDHLLLLLPRPPTGRAEVAPRNGCRLGGKSMYPESLDPAAELWLRSSLPRSPACRRLDALQAALKRGWSSPGGHSSQPSLSADPLG